MTRETKKINFKDKLKDLYYLKTVEEEEFQRWLHQNIHYNNGVYNIFRTNNKLTYPNITNNTSDYQGLKNFLNQHFNTKNSKQEKWFNWLDSKTSYLNGVVYLNDIIPLTQELTLNYTYLNQTVIGGKIMNEYNFTAKLTPSIHNQTVTVNASNLQTFTTNSNGEFNGRFTLPVGSRQITVNAVSKSDSKNYYIGLRKIITVR